MPRRHGPYNRCQRASDKRVLVNESACGAACEQTAKQPERQREVAGADHKRPSHPQQSFHVRLRMRRTYFLRITTTAPIASNATTARHIRIRLMVLAPKIRMHKRRFFRDGLKAVPYRYRYRIHSLTTGTDRLFSSTLTKLQMR